MLRTLASLLSLTLLAASLSVAEDQAAEARKIPSIDGGVGSCSVEWTVTGPDGKPVYATRVRVRIAYGFMGMRKLDLEAATNVDGKVRFEGLPEKVKQPLIFDATKDRLEGTATYDPSSECNGKHGILLTQSSQ
jgi:hypothetical protein